MALDTVLSLATDLLVVTACVLLVIQTASMVWSASLARQLRGQEGGLLARLLTQMAAAIFVGQILAVSRAVLLALYPTDSIDTRIVLFLIEEVVLVGVSARVMWQARSLRQPPEDGAGEAVIEGDAQGAAEVPISSLDKGATVDDGSDDGHALPPELDESPAG